MKRFLSVALALVILLCLVGCGGEDGVPNGMKLASNKDIVSYSLFVPEDWIIDEQSAMTMAHVSSANKSSVSVMQWNLTEQTKTIDLWWSDYHKKELQNSFDTFTVLEEGIEGEIDGIASKSYTYTVTISGTTYKYYVTAVIDQGSIHLITYTSTEALYDETLSTVKDQILANMKFN
jgi:ABC-type glycerol-3-phosphate transport system substrate-binding protein